jgi:hypothetical protein
MEKRALSSQHDKDPRTGYRIAWKHERKDGNSFSLLEVPKRAQPEILYAKSDRRIKIVFAQINSLSWMIMGTMGTDTLVNLGVKVSRPRLDNYHPPVVTKRDIEQFESEHDGRLIDISGNRTHFNMNAILPVENVANFLDIVWSRPVAKLGLIPEDKFPKISLVKLDHGRLKLPQKTIPVRDGKPGTALAVVKT